MRCSEARRVSDTMSVDRRRITKSPRKPRVFIEASFTFSTDLRTGIQRVVRKLVTPLVEMTGPELNAGCDAVVPVVIGPEGVSVLEAKHVKASAPQPELPGGVLGRASDRVARQMFRLASKAAAWLRGVALVIAPVPAVRRYVLAPRWEPGLSGAIARAIRLVPSRALHQVFAAPQDTEIATPRDHRLIRGIDFRAGDVLILLDSSWHQDFVFREIAKMRDAGVKIVFVIYDLIPLLHQEVVDGGLRDTFIKWVETTLELADGYVAISEAVAAEMRTYLGSYGVLASGKDPGRIPTAWFHLGAEICEKPRNAADRVLPNREIYRAKLSEGAFYLMVGTVEPRKRHLMVLEAFERLWKSDFEYRLVIAGRMGWLSPAQRRHFEGHPQRGKLMLHFENATDDDLQYLYANSRAVIQASLAEGFGLPIIEAAFNGKRVICSDIAVFREVAAAGTLFFARDSLDALVAAIREEARLPAAETVAGGAQPTSWDESRRWLVRESLLLADPDALDRGK